MLEKSCWAGGAELGGRGACGSGLPNPAQLLLSGIGADASKRRIKKEIKHFATLEASAPNKFRSPCAWFAPLSNHSMNAQSAVWQHDS